jgi:hypothetical protein
MSSLFNLTSSQLKRAASLKDQITKLEAKLASILGSAVTPIKTSKKGGMSAAGRAKVAAAQKARWAKAKKKAAPKAKSKMSAAGRARIAAAAKARWAKVKAAGKTKL